MRFSLRFATFMLSWFMLHAFTFPAQGETYVRVIAHDDSPFAQEQKMAVRDYVLSQLAKKDASSPDALEQLLLALGVPAIVKHIAWAPGFPYTPSDTLYITLGSGQGRNWWGVLCSDSLQWSFLQHSKNDDAPSGDAAVSHITLSFPLLSRLLSFLGLGQDELQIGQMGQ